MDNVTATLLDRLVDKTFEKMGQEERLAFVEKLFASLPPAGQQEFLLKLAGHIGLGELDKAFGTNTGEPVRVQVVKMGPKEFGPWQMCCQVMNDFVESPDAERMKTPMMARLFSGLADETRLKIIKLLSERERSVDELVGLLGIAQSTTSHHLRVLKEANLVQGEKRGRSTIYSLVLPLAE